MCCGCETAGCVTGCQHPQADRGWPVHIQCHWPQDRIQGGAGHPLLSLISHTGADNQDGDLCAITAVGSPQPAGGNSRHSWKDSTLCVSLFVTKAFWVHSLAPVVYLSDCCPAEVVTSEEDLQKYVVPYSVRSLCEILHLKWYPQTLNTHHRSTEKILAILPKVQVTCYS